MEEKGRPVFHQIGYSMDKLESAKKKINNPIWSEVFNSLKKLRSSVLHPCPEEYLSMPLLGVPDITNNFTGIKQD